MNKIVSSKITALTFGVLVVCFAIAFYVVAWQEPSQVPPGGNVPAPLNISATAQTKEGDLTINGVLKTLKDMIVNVVTIKGNGSMSPNLNSDKLDDYHAADLMAGGGGSGMYTTRCGNAGATGRNDYSLGECCNALNSMLRCTPPGCEAGDQSLKIWCYTLYCERDPSTYGAYCNGVGSCERLCRSEW